MENNKQEKSEEISSKVERSELYNEIYSIVKKIPRKDIEGDAMDAPSCALELEQLFISWKQDRKLYNDEQVELIANEMVNWAIDNIGNPNPESGKKFDEVLNKYKNVIG